MSFLSIRNIVIARVNLIKNRIYLRLLKEIRDEAIAKQVVIIIEDEIEKELHIESIGK